MRSRKSKSRSTASWSPKNTVKSRVILVESISTAPVYLAMIDSPHELISGRDFTVTFDKWGTEELAKRLDEEPDMYKLRRYGNDWLVKNVRVT